MRLLAVASAVSYVAGFCVEFAEKKLGIKCGETTPDGMFTLMEEECLGACTTAPAMMANDDYVENLDINKLNEFIEKAKAVKS